MNNRSWESIDIEGVQRNIDRFALGIELGRTLRERIGDGVLPTVSIWIPCTKLIEIGADAAILVLALPIFGWRVTRRRLLWSLVWRCGHCKNLSKKMENIWEWRERKKVKKRKRCSLKYAKGKGKGDMFG